MNFATIEELYQIYIQHPSVSTDTRSLPESCIFFALRGPNFNGNEYALQALKKGAAYAVVDAPKYAVSEQCLLVEDVLKALQSLARTHRRRLNIPFIAITGSNGKTTSKELLTAVLRKKYITYATEGNLNNHIGIPITLLRIKNDAELAIIEMGANHIKEIEGYCSIAEPTHGLITNCGKAHLEGFGSIEGVRKGKGELYDYLRTHNGIVFRNADLDYLAEMARGIAHQVTYGATPDAQYTGTPEMKDVFAGATIQLHHTPLEIQSQLAGSYNFANIMAAVAVGDFFQVPAKSIADAIAEYEPSNSRSQWISAGSNKVLLDAYNANPTSMEAAIESFAKGSGANKMLWLGAMKEMGMESEAEHRRLIDLIDRHQWAGVWLVGEEFQATDTQHRIFRNSDEAALALKEHLPAEATILIKGSRGSRMEKLYDVLRSSASAS